MKEYKLTFDKDLHSYIRAKCLQAKRTLKNPELATLLSSVEIIAAAGGKRARPYMAEGIYEALGGKDKELARTLGVGLELFHLFCLVHDDVIDKGKTRHGVSTVHHAETARLKKSKRRGDIPHLANGQAVLIGDLLFSWSYECVARAAMRTPAGLQLLEIFSRMVSEVVAGQMLDVDMMSRTAVTEKEVTRKNLLKTATYTFVRPLQLGASLAGKLHEVEGTLKDYGESLGLGFQLQDDYFDIWTLAQKTGKPACADIADGAHTPISAYVLTATSKTDQRKFLSYFGRGLLTPKEIKEVRILLERVGAKDFATQSMQDIFAQTEQVLARAKMSPSVETFLSELLKTVAQRHT